MNTIVTQTKLVQKVTKQDFTVYIFCCRMGRTSTTQPIVVHPKRGFLAPVLYKDRIKAVEYALRNEGAEDLKEICGLPSLNSELQYANFPDKLAEAMAKRAVDARYHDVNNTVSHSYKHANG